MNPATSAVELSRKIELTLGVRVSRCRSCSIGHLLDVNELDAQAARCVARDLVRDCPVELGSVDVLEQWSLEVVRRPIARGLHQRLAATRIASHRQFNVAVVRHGVTYPSLA
jgi:hypothetical protein